MISHLEDAHSFLLFPHPKHGFHSYPIRVFKFSNRWFVTDVGRKLKKI